MFKIGTEKYQNILSLSGNGSLETDHDRAWARGLSKCPVRGQLG